jgi:hypothetical protein
MIHRPRLDIYWQRRRDRLTGCGGGEAGCRNSQQIEHVFVTLPTHRDHVQHLKIGVPRTLVRHPAYPPWLVTPGRWRLPYLRDPHSGRDRRRMCERRSP